MNLLIDIGNTRVKAVVYFSQDNEWLDLPSVMHTQSKVDFKSVWQSWKNTIEDRMGSSQLPPLDSIGVASVNQGISSSFINSRPQWAQTDWISAKAEHQFEQLTNAYSKPSNMGVDRWLAMIAASNGGSKPCLVVDAGTALTLDWISRGGSHLGGYIIPGLNQQLTALLAGTERVFADRWSELNTLSPGRDTSACVLNGLLAQICGFIGFQAESAASAGIDKLVLTGGDSGLLAPHLKPIVERYSVALELRPRLVFEGLLAVTRKLDKKS